jgi:hypothetical protein
MQVAARVCFALLLCSSFLSAQSADFSGTWTMDLTRSEAAAQGTPIGPVTVVIRQAPSEVRIETSRGETKDVVTYLPVGARTPDAGGSSGTFKWDGPRLVTNLITHVNNQAVTVQETRTLNSDATEMTVDVTLVVEHGYQSGGSSVVASTYPPNWAKGKNVFVKAR